MELGILKKTERGEAYDEHQSCRYSTASSVGIIKGEPRET
jgi:hypothetical protein